MKDTGNDEDDNLVKLNDVEKEELIPNNKKNFIKNIIIILLVLIIIGLAIYIIFFMRKDKKDKKDKKDNEVKNKGCKSGYFIPDDDYDDLTMKKCEKCSVSNCDVCTGTKSNNTCLNCTANYYLVNDACKSYSFMAKYIKGRENEETQLINNTYLSYIKGMYMNNSEISIASSINFTSIGNHTIYFDMDISSLDDLTKMFYGKNQMLSIYFSPAFNTKNINKMDYMFMDCRNLTSVNLSNFNTKNVKSMNCMVYEMLCFNINKS